MLSGYNLKILYKSTSITKSKDALLYTLSNTFNRNLLDIPNKSIQVNYRYKDVLTSNKLGTGVTLLQKTAYNNYQATHFYNSGKEKINTILYPYYFTRDALSLIVELQASNYRRKGSIAYNKIYNSNKIILKLPIKDITLFGNY